MSNALRRCPIRTLLVGASLATLLGCSGSPNGPPTPSCVANLTTTCQPLYDPPTYQAIYDNILHTSCAIGLGSCHTSDAAKGGLVLDSADVAYAGLLGTMGGRARVQPGDPACSLLVIRLESSDPNFVMPKGSRLSEQAICDFVQWISQGAKR
jgi:hypothetical protein